MTFTSLLTTIGKDFTKGLNWAVTYAIPVEKLGLEQTVDTANGIRQLFPVLGAYSPTALYYGGATSAVVGQMNQTSGYLNVSAGIATATRSGNVVTVTAALPANINGLTATISGVSDASYDGSFSVTMTGANSFTYAQNGPDGASTGGTVAVLTGGFVLYPMAEVLSVFDPAAKSVDGLMTLAPNNVAWAQGDPVEEPHYFQELVSADTEFLGQSVPRPTTLLRAGLQYQQNNGPGLIGWSIANAAPTANYMGYGGTHGFPTAAYEATGIWNRTMSLTAGEQAAFAVHCNGHGCGSWNSAYNLFELDSSAGADTVNYAPATSALNLYMRGTAYSFSPQAFTAGTINAGTLNATSISTGALNLGSLSASGAVSAASGSFGTLGAISGSSLAVTGGLATFRSPGHTAVAIGSGTPIDLGDDAYLTALAGSATPNAGMLLGRNSSAGFASVDLITSGNTGVGWSMQMQPGSTDWVLVDRANASNAIDCAAGTANACTFSKPVSAAVYQGPATAPSGGCSTVGWAFSQDGHATFCNGSVWVPKL